MIEQYPDLDHEGEPQLGPSDRFDLFLMTMPGWNDFVDAQPESAQAIYERALSRFTAIEPEIIKLCDDAEFAKVATSSLFTAFHEQQVSTLDMALQPLPTHDDDGADQQP